MSDLQSGFFLLNLTNSKSCTNLPTGIQSYKVIGSGDSICPPCPAGNGLFNSFVFGSEKNVCGESDVVGGGGAAGCEPEGCLPMGGGGMGHQIAHSIQCIQDFCLADDSVNKTGAA